MKMASEVRVGPDESEEGALWLKLGLSSGRERRIQIGLPGGVLTREGDVHALTGGKPQAKGLEFTKADRGGRRGWLLRDLSGGGVKAGGGRVVEVWLQVGWQACFGGLTLTVLPSPSRESLAEDKGFGESVGQSPSMQKLFAVLHKVAPQDLTILLRGETGSGKERLARSIHRESPRRGSPWVVLDCSAISRELAESVLFGHARGAFTGAMRSLPGVFEQADGGTLLLDEIGELPLDLQPKLLRVLEQREVTRLGEEVSRAVDVRIIVATSHDLSRRVAEGSFREDLFFRLSVVCCVLPPLRERQEDIPLLVASLVAGLAGQRLDLPGLRVSREAVGLLSVQRWPGNIRQLKNVLERAVSLAERPLLGPRDLGLQDQALWSASEPNAPTREAQEEAALSVSLVGDFSELKRQLIDDFERAYLSALLDRTGGNISRAARESGLTRYYLRERLKKHGLYQP